MNMITAFGFCILPGICMAYQDYYVIITGSNDNNDTIKRIVDEKMMERSKMLNTQPAAIMFLPIEPHVIYNMTMSEIQQVIRKELRTRQENREMHQENNTSPNIYGIGPSVLSIAIISITVFLIGLLARVRQRRGINIIIRIHERARG